LTADKIQALLRFLPEVATEGNRVDFERLKLALGESVEVGRERYGFNWSGKADCFRVIQSPSLGTLRPKPDQGREWNSSENLFIEGDNLEVLKLLQKPYLGRVKMIYIDPPYNTGNDFIYPDNYAETLQTYLEYTGQVDAEGKKFSTNTESEGRFHSKWMSMMYSRLYLARNLLSDDGAIFVSIDDSEAHHLRAVMDEIFGEDSFVGTFVWQSKKGGGSDKGGVVNDQEYVVCYAKSTGEEALSRVEIEGEELDRKDSRGAFRRGRELNKWGSNSRREDRPTMWFPVKGPNAAEVYPIRNDGSEGCWRWGRKKMEEIVQRGDAEFVQREDGTYIVYEKIRSTDPRYKPFRTWMPDVGATADGTKEVKELFGGKKAFDFPKPLSLLKRLVEIGTDGEGDIVLDFFAGSGTTAHALWLVNQADGGTRRFILVQLPEPCSAQSEASKMGLGTISQVCRERLGRAAKSLATAPKNGRLDPPSSSDEERATNLDLGFKCYELAASNFTPWDASKPNTADALQRQIVEHVRHIRKDRSSEDILVEILFKSGFPLTTSVEPADFAGSNAFSVAGGALLICLERRLSLEIIRAIADRKPERVVCLDEGFSGNDQLKANAVQTFRTKGVASFKTV
jgi:adenine-specific DNA-methyltransferase